MLAKKTMIFAIVGVVVLLLGIGGGVYVGLTYFSGGDSKATARKEPPGPIFEMGDFTVNLADPEPHIARLGVTLELANDKILSEIGNPSWLPILKNEILLTVKDRRFAELKSAEGMQALAQDLRGRINAILPDVKGVAPVRQVLFGQFVLQ